MRIRDTFLGGIGVCVPPPRPIGDVVAEGLVPPGALDGHDITAVAIADGTPPMEMALRAAEDALKSGGLSPADLAVLLYASVWHQGPDGWGPQYHLQRHLVGDDLLAVGIRHGCNGMFSAIELAVPYLRACPQHRAALVVSADSFATPLLNRWHLGAGLSVMADGAAALALTRDEGFAQLLSLCTTTYSAMEEVHRAGEPLHPPGVTEGRALDFGARAEAFREQAIADGTWMRHLVEHQKHNVACVSRALAEAGITVADIRRVITHTIPRQDAEAYLGVLGLPLERSTWDFGSGIGHLGAGDHAVALHHLLTTHQLRPGDHVLLCGFSPGVTYKAAVVRITATPWTYG